MIPANRWLRSMVTNMSGNFCFMPETSHNLGHTIVSCELGEGGGGSRSKKKVVTRQRKSNKVLVIVGWLRIEWCINKIAGSKQQQKNTSNTLENRIIQIRSCCSKQIWFQRKPMPMPMPMKSSKNSYNSYKTSHQYSWCCLCQAGKKASHRIRQV